MQLFFKHVLKLYLELEKIFNKIEVIRPLDIFLKKLFMANLLCVQVLK